MRFAIAVALLCGFLLAGISRAEDADAQKVVDKALAALGNPSGKQAAVVWRGKGTFYGMGDGLPYTGTWSLQRPDKFRMEIDGAFTLIVNGDKGWIMGQEMTKEQLTEQRQSLHADWILQIYPLKDKAFSLTVLGESKVEDKPAVGLKVSYKDRRDVKVYFDKETGLPVKMEQTVMDEQAGKEVTQESLIKEWVKTDNGKLPSKMLITRDGKKYVDGEMQEYKLSEKLPDETFKP